MWLNADDFVEVSRWTNGAKSTVAHWKRAGEDDLICKHYKPGYLLTLLREFVVLRYLAKRIENVPSIIGVNIRRRTLYLAYVPGKRMLEWVLERFGPADLVAQEFKSFHGLESNEIVLESFRRFRASTDEEATELKRAIISAYSDLHACRLTHGDPSPRNLIFDGEKITLIDFDHSRPSWDPLKVDGTKLSGWYGLDPENKSAG